MLKLKKTRWMLAVGGLVLLAIVWGLGERHLRLATADRGFKSYTGISLPSDVTIIAHGSEVNDNFLHSTHAWMLNGPVSSLRGLASSFGLERSDDDAKWQLPNVQQMFGVLAVADVVEGYEGIRDGKRDRWLLILANGQGAVFIY